MPTGPGAGPQQSAAAGGVELILALVTNQGVDRPSRSVDSAAAGRAS